MKGFQLHTGSNSDFVMFYNIDALQRCIFLDKERRVISADEIRPSNPETLKKLEATLTENIA